MKKLLAYCFFFFVIATTHAQYYLRGIIRNEKSELLSNAKIYLHSQKSTYTSGSDGSFGISTKMMFDSVTVTAVGYDVQTIKVKTDQWLIVILKPTAATLIRYKPKLISFTKDANETARFNPFISDETYFKLVENEFVKTVKFPKTGFSLNVNKAAYSNVRRFINMGSKVPPDAVRIEEMINYFNLGYEQPENKDIFKIKTVLGNCPWNKEHYLLHVKINAKKIDLSKIPAGNFVFLVDVSGSMDMPNRLPLLKEAFQLFVKNLRAIDKVSIVTYGGVVGTWLQPTSGAEKDKINNSLEQLTAAGDTPGESAIVAAYKLAKASFIVGGNNRVIIATDGDFNVGQTSEKALDELITKQRETGVYLTCLGVGMGNFKDSKLQTLAKRGNGNYAYLDNLHEAEKVLVHELTETLYSVADDAYISIVFDPSQIKTYRLIGFDNKREAVQDGSSVIEGGEIGSGGGTIAVFEIEKETSFNEQKEIGKLFLKFHDTEEKKYRLQNLIFSLSSTYISEASNNEKFAAVVALYGLKLKQSIYFNNTSWKEIKQLALDAVDPTNYLQNDFLKLVDKTIEIYEPSKKKKKNKN